MIKRFVKIGFLGLVVANLFLAQATMALAATQRDSYIGSGAEASIKLYLCTPSATTDAAKKMSNVYTSSAEIDANSAAVSNSAQGDLYNCINRLYRFAIVIAGAFGVLMIVVAGYIYMSADGSDEAVSKAKDILTTTIVSMIILMAGYVLLRAINPDLIQFQQIQPPSVTVKVANAPSPTNVITTYDASGQPISITGGAGRTASELTAAGCDFQSGIGSLVPNITQGLFDKLKIICSSVSTGGTRPQISSLTGGKHATNSYHYKGCAADFAGGNTNYVNSAVGKAVIQAATAQGMRVNPRPDDAQTYHVHVDLGTACTSAGPAATGTEDPG